MITGFILTFNEMFYIKASLNNLLKHVDEVIILDGGSTDGTLQYIEEMSNKHPKIRLEVWPQSDGLFFGKDWNEAERVNWCIENAKHNWLFWLGADECLADHADLRKVVKGTKPSCTGYKFPRYNLSSYDTYVKQWYPDPQMRLFNRDAQGGLRLSSQFVHGTIQAKMGTCAPSGIQHSAYYITHYHDACGPKQSTRSLHKNLHHISFLSRLHPKDAQKYLFDEPIKTEFDYSRSLRATPPDGRYIK